jgi:BirA family biotin operon repressor/biotin-[acetyl-CoA-carboxylase] ligase
MKFGPVIWFDSLGSTNLHLRKMLSEDTSLRSGTVIAARQQTEGRGRGERKWVSTAGKDLTFSFFLRAEVELASIASLALVAGLGVVEALEKVGVRGRLKWPNDVLTGGRKICGILSEHTGANSGGSAAAIVGVGVNLNMNEAESAKIDAPATSVFIETGRCVEVDCVLELILGRLGGWIERWEKGGFAAVRYDWLAVSDDVGRSIKVMEVGGGSRSGTFAGVGEMGELLLKDAGGSEHRIWAGDVLLMQ